MKSFTYITNFSEERTEKSPEELFSSIQESLDSSVSSASSLLKDTYSNINASILKSTKNLIDSFENAISGILPLGDDSGGFTLNNSIDFMSPFQMETPANHVIKKVVLIVEDSAGSVSAIVVNLITDFYGFIKASLPPEVQSVLDVAEENASKIINGIYNYLSIPTNVSFTEDLQPATEAESIVSDLLISIGNAVVNTPSVASGEGMEVLSDPQVSTDSLPSFESTINSYQIKYQTNLNLLQDYF